MSNIYSKNLCVFLKNKILKKQNYDILMHDKIVYNRNNTCMEELIKYNLTEESVNVR